MGINANATCLLNFDGAVGYMISEPNKGLEAMFTFMNTARIGTAIQGVASAELSFQGSLPYAKERRSMRALSGKKEARASGRRPDLAPRCAPHVAHAKGHCRRRARHDLRCGQNCRPDVQRREAGDNKAYKKYENELGFFTPILKGFLTEMGLEAANLGVQVFGGHGYIGEHGMEQIVRDARISTLYEGTTGIQALDLLGRKVLLSIQRQVRARLHLADGAVRQVQGAQAHPFGRDGALFSLRAAEWNALTMAIMLRARKDREVVGAASFDYLMYSGYVMMAFSWAQQAAKARELLDSGTGKESAEFYKAKIQTAEFYFDRLLPRANAHRAGALASTKSLMQMDKDHFNFA
jgi:hypothetical protein